MSGTDTTKVQTNLTLSAPRAAALDIAASPEGKDKAAIVEEALELRERLMGQDYKQLMQHALTLRFSERPALCLQAIEALREDVPGTTPDGSTTVSAARAILRARSAPFLPVEQDLSRLRRDERRAYAHGKGMGLCGLWHAA